jgi:hypothetical protein
LLLVCAGVVDWTSVGFSGTAVEMGGQGVGSCGESLRQNPSITSCTRLNST